MPLYLINNTSSEKYYVGQTATKIRYRWAAHRCAAGNGKDTLLYNAIRKYGVNAFHIQELSPCLNPEQLNNLEKVWIILLQSNDRDFGYNLTNGGERTFKMSEEARQKIRVAAIKRCQSPEHRKKLSDASKGRPAWNKGKRLSKDYGERVSQGLRKYWATKPPETRQQMVGDLHKIRWGG